MKCQECGKDGEGDVCAFCGGTIEESPRWYAEGIAHLTEQKQYAIAFDLLEEGIERYSQSAMLWYNGGVLEELLGNRDGAITRYQKVLDLRPNNEKARKALERLLGRPLFTPPPTTSYATAQAAAPAETAVAPPPAVAAPAPPPAPAAPPTATFASTAPAPAPEASPARVTVPTPGPNGADAVAVQPEMAMALSLPPVETGGLPWAKIRMITGIGAIVTFLLLLIGLIAMKSAIVFIIALILFCITLTTYYVAGAYANIPYHRRRR